MALTKKQAVEKAVKEAIAKNIVENATIEFTQIGADLVAIVEVENVERVIVFAATMKKEVENMTAAEIVAEMVETAIEKANESAEKAEVARIAKEKKLAEVAKKKAEKETK
jgi:hypothetical protein